MTVCGADSLKPAYKEKSNHSVMSAFVSFVLLILVLLYGIFGAEKVVPFVIEGMKLAAFYIIPSAFPFMIISELYMCYGRTYLLKFLEVPVRWLFGFSGFALTPLVCGNIGGFPQGSFIIKRMYNDKMLTKVEAESLLPLCNNVSVPFVVGCVGVGMFGSHNIGIILLVSVVVSNIICGIIFKNRSDFSNKSRYIIGQNFNFIDCVKNTGRSCLDISSFIIMFSCVCGFLKTLPFNNYIKGVVLSVFEVTNGVKYFSDNAVFPSFFGIVFSAFALGFGGLSALIQSMAIMKGTDISFKKYICFKILEGVFSAIISGVICLYLF